MNPATLETFRQRLLAQQQQIVKRIFNLEEDLHSVNDAEREVERTDRIQAEASEEVLEKLDEQSRREIEAIQMALHRMDEGTYGSCETCGNDINPARLAAMPMARRCLPCQKLTEKE
jgi:DnaK suppressor protein